MAHPLHSALNDLASYETENMAWLRKAGPIARRLNEESRLDCDPSRDWHDEEAIYLADLNRAASINGGM